LKICFEDAVVLASSSTNFINTLNATFHFMQIIRGKEHFHGGFEGPLVFLIFFLIRRMGVFSLKVSTISQSIYDGSSEVFREVSKRERDGAV
jgi:hypothetical protein